MQLLPLLSSWLPVVLWAGFIYFLSDIPRLHSGLENWDFFLRKGAHMLEYAILTFLILRAVRSTWSEARRRRALVASAAAALLYAVSDEVHQHFVPGRGASAADVFVDLCGILLFGLVIVRTPWWSRWEPPR